MDPDGVNVDLTIPPADMPCPAKARTRASREPTTISDERGEKDLSPNRQRPHPGKGEAVEIDEV